MILKQQRSLTPQRNLTHQQFQALAPIESHRTPATCAEVQCAHHVSGWQTIVPVGSDHEAFLDAMRGRRYVKRIDGEMAAFIFYPGQTCFRRHSKSLDRPPVLVHRKDWIGYRRALGPNEWHDTFATTLEGLKRERG